MEIIAALVTLLNFTIWAVLLLKFYIDDIIVPSVVLIAIGIIPIVFIPLLGLIIQITLVVFYMIMFCHYLVKENTRKLANSVKFKAFKEQSDNLCPLSEKELIKIFKKLQKYETEQKHGQR